MIGESFKGRWVEVTLRSGRQLDGFVERIHNGRVFLRKTNYGDVPGAGQVTHMVDESEIAAVTFS